MSAVEDMEKQGTVIPVVKHFPGHGDTAVDSPHGAFPWWTSLTLEDSERAGALRHGSLRPVLGESRFMEADSRRQGGPHPPGVRSTRTTRPPCLPRWVTGLLREEMGYEGAWCAPYDLTMGPFPTPRYGGGRRTGPWRPGAICCWCATGGQPGRGPTPPPWWRRWTAAVSRRSG